MQYEPVIGLEIHVELKTKSKMFCGCKNDPFYAEKPNMYTCPVCFGLPGGLPVPNKKAIEWTILLGMALGSTIASFSKFDRKHYFYPDLAKGYQITQFDEPFCSGGFIKTSFGNVRIRRVHLEEDTGKLIHKTIVEKKVTLIDFNRSGVPLVEIVTEPDIHSSEQAKEFLKKLHQIVRYLEISDADLEKGSMRLEPNISVWIKGSNEIPAYKVEVKNINSFKFVAAAIEYEFKRHVAILEEGKVPVQETRGWDEGKNATVSQRKKEGASDYRYFPEPDIPPLRFTKEYIEALRNKLPKLADEVKDDIIKAYGLNDYQGTILVENVPMLSLFQGTVSLPSIQQANISGTTIANWVINKVTDFSGTAPIDLANQIIGSKTVVVSDSELKAVILNVLEENPKAVSDYKAGKEQSAMFLMGMVRRQLPNVDTNVILEAVKAALKNV